MTTPKAATQLPDGTRRYRIPDPVTGEVHDLPNVSSVLDVIHTFGLEGWKLRNAIVGVAMREDLLVQTVAAHLMGDPKERNVELKRLAHEAIDAGQVLDKGKLAADFGSGLHLLTEALDDGAVGEFTALPGDLADYAAAYVTRMVGVEVVESEFTVYGQGYAGTADRIVRFTEAIDGELAESLRLYDGCFILDIKTGAVREKAALQLAALANGHSVYDAVSGEHRPLPADLRRDIGFILDLKAQRAQIVPVELGPAWPAFLGALAIKSWADTKPLGTPLPPARAHVPTSPPAEGPLVALPDQATVEIAETDSLAAKRAWLVQRIEALDTDGRAALARAWPPGVPTFKASTEHSQAELEAIEGALWRAEGEVGASFPDVDPTDRRFMTVAADDERLVTVHERAARLPRDLAATVDQFRAANGIAKPGHPSTETKLSLFEGAVAGAEKIWSHRAGRIADLLALATEHGLSATAIREVLDVGAEADLTVEHEACLDLLIDATVLGAIVEREGHIVVERPALALVERFAGRRIELLRAAKAVADQHGWPRPGSSDEALADPLIVAALVAA